jgi:hypothetical protein
VKKLILLIIIISMNIMAQWSNNPSTNLAICNTAGEQTLAKISTLSDGGTYISWFDNRSGSYAVYLQRLDPLGNKMWATDGLLISNNPQSTSLVDYDLTTDNNNNAVLVFTDTRNSGSLNVFAYRISPTGSFLWGANGVGLSSTSDYQANPKVVQANDGNFVICWIVAAAPNRIALQKLSPEGTKLWGSAPVIVSSTTEGFTNPGIVPTDSNGVIILHTATTGNFPAQTVKIRATKVSSSGSVSWQMYLQDIGRLAAFTVPKVYSDMNNGGIIAWHDDRDQNNLQSGFVQRVSSNGTIYFPVNGAEVSLSAGTHKFNPVASFDPASGEMSVFWFEASSNQSQYGIFGQKLSSSGNRLWTDNAKQFKPLSEPNSTSFNSLNVKGGGNRTYVFYLEGNGSGLNPKVEGFSCDASGNFLWTGNFVVLSNPTAEKLQMVAAIDVFNNCKMAWGDSRGSTRDIYAQDINMNGALGNPVIPVELVSFTVSVSGEWVVLNWVTSTETNNLGFDIERKREYEDFQVIGFLAGKGSTTETSVYTFTDHYINSGKTFYRLKQVDLDGSINYSDVIEVENNSPLVFSLEQNYPNPFNPSTKIKFSLLSEGFVTLRLFDVLGQEVKILLKEFMREGNHSVDFNAEGLTSGVYIYKIESGIYSSMRKMLLMK